MQRKFVSRYFVFKVSSLKCALINPKLLNSSWFQSKCLYFDFTCKSCAHKYLFSAVGRASVYLIFKRSQKFWDSRGCYYLHAPAVKTPQLKPLRCYFGHLAFMAPGTMIRRYVKYRNLHKSIKTLYLHDNRN